MALTKITGTGVGLITGDIATSTAGTSNFRAGVNAGNSIASGGNYNVVVGDEAGTAITTGDYNTGLGYKALEAHTTGTRNIAVGSFSLDANTTASDNTAVGYSGLGVNTTGVNNVAFGNHALESNTTASNNTAVGYSALTANTTGYSNVALGAQTAIGNTTGNNNLAAGRYALYTNTTGSGNAALGLQALFANTTASNNVAVGFNSLVANTTGASNTAIGYHAAGNVTTASGIVCLGNQAGLGLTTTTSNLLYIARSNTGHNNAATWIHGSTSGDCYQGDNSSTWSTTSDRRIKKNIVDSSTGLTAINNLKIRNFEYKTLAEAESGEEGLNYIDKTGVQTGVIAQEIQSVFPNSVKTHVGTGTLSVSPDEVQWALVKAVQELSAKNDALEARITALE